MASINTYTETTFGVVLFTILMLLTLCIMNEYLHLCTI
jgi:hypothetical protein